MNNEPPQFPSDENPPQNPGGQQHDPSSPYHAPQSPPPAAGSLAALTQDDRTMGMLCHLLAFAFAPIGTLVLWLLKKDTMPFVDDQGKEALNFQISVWIYSIVSGFLCIVGIGFILLPIVTVGSIVFIILAAVAANNGTAYRYPFTIRLIK
ncbi:DUF4870 domain-containing protein [Sulfuriroseicoccus oceanibius]|uniref:DUF4870 domain-containing protein n=1 Tax=Sulfuriroseicoccus oceanibius TaxID=2707525 RepID=A0A7T7F168_9BACT|nr:DUF4870 domain-containing protein [Sulfuriroseicoccus oceanibius]QQL44645.1 DUF4870 domain-containing protein [Sulfuriroseicoccus oceanibius]